MKNGIAGIVGKTISRVVVAENSVAPKQQVFILFTDGKYFEFWGESFSCNAAIDFGCEAEVLRYIKNCAAKVTNVYPASPLHQSGLNSQFTQRPPWVMNGRLYPSSD